MKNSKTATLTRFALFAAIIIVMSYTPLGYLNLGLFMVTFLTIPVIVAALLFGSAAGAFAGLIFGLTSFAKSFGSVMGAELLAINPVYTFILAVVPRVLEGYLCGVIFSALNRKSENKLWKTALASFSCPALNTILYMGTLVLLFGNSEYIRGLMGGKNIFMFAVSFVGIQAVVEACICTVIGTVICGALLKYFGSGKGQR